MFDCARDILYVVVMYLRKTSRRYKDKTYTNYVLVESVRTPKGPRQKTICTLGDLAPRPRHEWLKLAHKIEQALSDQPEFFEASADPEVEAILAKVRARRKRAETGRRGAGSAPIAVEPDKVTTERHREAGPVHVGLTFWRRLGLEGILEELGLDEKTRRLTGALS